MRSQVSSGTATTTTKLPPPGGSGFRVAGRPMGGGEWGVGVGVEDACVADWRGHLKSLNCPFVRRSAAEQVQRGLAPRRMADRRQRQPAQKKAKWSSRCI
jgi:hypothetical protein